jgi:hypothetical protein
VTHDEARVMTAKELKARGRQVVTLPDGGRILVRRLSRAELTEILRAMPDIGAIARFREKTIEQAAADIQEGRLGEVLADAAAVYGLMKEVILACVVEPKLHARAEDGPTPDDFTQVEKGVLFDEIVKFSKFLWGAGVEVLPSSQATH